VKRYANGKDKESTANTPMPHVNPSIGKSVPRARNPDLMTESCSLLADTLEMTIFIAIIRTIKLARRITIIGATNA
jgi:hypothetical protein